MSAAGFYKRRRGILEHLEAGRISLLDLAVHDLICLRANAVVGNGSFYPPGVWMGSAAAIHALCPKQISNRSIRRSLDHLEKLGWIKRWKTGGRHGNYPILIARFSVHDVSGNEYSVNAEKTTDWKAPVLASVRDASMVGKIADHLPPPNKEIRSKKKTSSESSPSNPILTKFNEFWKIYPNKVAKKTTFKVFKKINPSDALLKQILAALERQAASEKWQRDGGKYIPNPPTWLNGNRWEDEVETVRQKSNTGEEVNARLAMTEEGKKVYQKYGITV